MENSDRRRSVNLVKPEDILLQKEAGFAFPVNENRGSLENLTPRRLKKIDGNARCARIAIIEPRLEQSVVSTPGRSSLKLSSRIISRSIPDITGS